MLACIALMVFLFEQYLVTGTMHIWSEEQNKNQENLVHNLRSEGHVRSEEVARAMLLVDRGYYSKINPYADTASEIGYGATISEPHMHAYALETLKDHLKNGQKFLDVGCGSGYLTVCMAVMAKKTSCVIGIDHMPELISFAHNNIDQDKSILLEENRIKLFEADGRRGFAQEAPYDAIYVGGALCEMPEDMLNQLKLGGRLVIPLQRGAERQKMWVFDKHKNGTITKRDDGGVYFVALINRDVQYPGHF